jgi:hypothetical protein
MSIGFANGTEGDAWMHVWCDHCARDHGVHDESGPGCSIVMHLMTAESEEADGWPEPLLRTKDYWKSLPADIACAAFTPCAACGGDPLAVTRAAVVARIVATVQESGR